jgi:thiol-disulfide isomerase/thioredoxin
MMGTSMPNRFVLLAAATILAASLCMAGCQSKSNQTAGTTDATSRSPGPEVTTPLTGLDGSVDSVAAYKGKVVLVNFWATWCQPCKEEIPWLIEFNQKYGPKGLVILGVAMDDEGKKVVEPWVREQRFNVNGQQEPMDYKIMLGNDTIADKFGGLIGMPTSMLYSREGKKVKTIIGEINRDNLAKVIEGQL